MKSPAQLPEIAGLSAIILCGGKSRRMGTDKTFCLFEGLPLYKHVLNAVSGVCRDIVLVHPRPEQFPCTKTFRVITDEPGLAGKGPLAGIISGLKVINNEKAFVAACDMPYISPEAVRDLEHAFGQAPGCMIMLSRTATAVEPLFSIFTKQALPALEAMVLSGEYRARETAGYVQTGYFEITDETLTGNINTPADLKGYTRD